jgi:hypothetical protein
MHISPDNAQSMAAVLGCPISSFPQPYLGLPLSPHKTSGLGLCPAPSLL